MSETKKEMFLLWFLIQALCAEVFRTYKSVHGLQVFNVIRAIVKTFKVTFEHKVKRRNINLICLRECFIKIKIQKK